MEVWGLFFFFKWRKKTDLIPRDLEQSLIEKKAMVKLLGCRWATSQVWADLKKGHTIDA